MEYRLIHVNLFIDNQSNGTAAIERSGGFGDGPNFRQSYYENNVISHKNFTWRKVQPRLYPIPVH